MLETEYHRHADAQLDALSEMLEPLDAQGLIEMEYEDGAITVQWPSGKTMIISKHVASRQIWLSSPVSGGLHFRLVLPPPAGGRVRVGASPLVQNVEPAPSLTLSMVKKRHPDVFFSTIEPAGGGNHWTLPDGRNLAQVVADELRLIGEAA